MAGGIFQAFKTPFYAPLITILSLLILEEFALSDKDNIGDKWPLNVR